jgi:asparagine synthetase B (glutamine-hydrolysing)
MCGIIGFIDPELELHQKEKIGQRMLQRIIHRGPMMLQN